MARKLANINKIPKDRTTYTRPEGAGNFDNMDDMNIVNQVNTKIGTVDLAPTDDKHIANKKYVDDSIEPLTDDSMADALHRHSELSASDGTPNPALSVDATGNVGIGTVEPDYKLDVYGDINIQGSSRIYFNGKRSFEGTLSNALATIGEGYLATNLKSSAVGVGTNDPQNKLDVLGAMVVGSSYASVNTAPTDGLLVEGNVGIGVTDPHSKLEVNGAISSTTGTFSTTGPTDNVDVTNVNTIFVNTASNNVTIGGFAGGVAGQQLNIIKTSTSNGLTLENNEGGGSQDIFTHDAADLVLEAGKRGGCVLICDGSDWYCADAAH